MLSHGNFLSFLAAFIRHEDAFKSSDIYLSFLPLPHVLERAMLISLLYCGAFTAYL